MRNIFMMTVMAALLAQPAFATKPDMLGGNRVMMAGCQMVENNTVGVNFNLVANSIADAKAQFDKKTAEVAQVAKEAKLEALEPQSMNYNIYAQNNNGNRTYTLNGNYQYKMDSGDAAFAFASALEKKDFSVNISSNAYRQGACASQVAD